MATLSDLISKIAIQAEGRNPEVIRRNFMEIKRVLAAVAASDLNISGLTEEAGVDPDADYVPYYDTSAAANRKATPRDLVPTSDTGQAGPSDYVRGDDPRLTNAREGLIDALTAISSADAANDFISLWDGSSKQVKKMSLANLGVALTASLDINGLTEETDVDPDGDFVAGYDTSAGANRKFKPRNLVPFSDTAQAGPSDAVRGDDPRLTNAREPIIDALPIITPDTAADYLPLFDASGKKVGKCLPSAFGFATSGGDFVADLVNSEGSITGTYTTDADDFGIVHDVSGSSDYTITLIAASGNAGKMLGMRFTNTGMTSVRGNGTETINGKIFRYYMAGDFAWFYCDGSNWHAQQTMTPVGCRAYRSSNQTITTPSTAERIDLNAEDYDYNGDFDHVTNYEFTAPCTGYYDIKGQIYHDTGVSLLMIAYPEINGTQRVTATAENNGTGSLANLTTSFSTIYRVAKGQTVELWGNRTAAGNFRAGANSTWLEVHRIDDRNF